MVKINIPSRKGHEVKNLPLLDAKKLVTEYTQRGWLSVINGRIGNPTDIKEEDNVTLYPRVMGG